MSEIATRMTNSSTLAQQRKQLSKLLHDVPYLKNQPDEVIAALAQTATLKEYPAGSVIFWEGDATEGVYIIENGIVKVARISVEGREHILHLLQSGDTFNDVAGIGGGANPATALAYSDVSVWCICREELQRIATRFPDFSWALVESLAHRARYLMGVVEDLSMRSVRGRLCKLLLEQARANESDSIPRLMTQQDMAGRLGTVREVVGRALRALASEEIIRFDHNRIVILDAERLAEESDA